VLPALGLLALGLRLWRHRAAAGVPWWWLAGAAALDLLALGALAYAVAEIVGTDGRGVDAVAGMPVVVLIAWLVTLAGAVATGLLARRAWRNGARLRSPAMGVVLAGSAWLLLAIYWLV
jgi:hypothetical protein